jgi:hypothetical protein
MDDGSRRSKYLLSPKDEQSSAHRSSPIGDTHSPAELGQRHKDKDTKTKTQRQQIYILHLDRDRVGLWV